MKAEIIHESITRPGFHPGDAGLHNSLARYGPLTYAAGMPRTGLSLSVLLLLLTAAALPARAADPPAVPASAIAIPRGAVVASASTGVVSLAGDRTFIADGTLAVGLPADLAFHAPVALAFAPVKRPSGNGLAVAAGIADLSITPGQQLIYTPSLALYGAGRLSTTGSFLFFADFTAVAVGLPDRMPAFLRGGGALRIALGPYLTWHIGLSYQRRMMGGPLPDDADHSGFAGASRVSVGSVRTTPFADTPLFVIHAHKYLDVILIARVDIDPDTDTTDSRILAGLQFHTPARHFRNPE